MGLKEKKLFSEKLKKWEEYKEVIENREIEYCDILQTKYEKKLNEIIEEFKTYCKSNNLNFIESKIFIDANLENYLKLRINFDPPKAAKDYKFLLSIIEEKRREFIIVIKPQYDVYLPSLFKQRPKPQSLDQMELMTDNLIKENDYIQLQNEKLKNIKFNLIFYADGHKPSDYLGKKKNNSLIDIIEGLLSNN